MTRLIWGVLAVSYMAVLVLLIGLIIWGWG